MTQREFASVLFAAIGVFIAVMRLPELFSMASVLMAWDQGAADTAVAHSSAVWTLVGLVFVFLAGVSLILFRQPLAARLFPGTTEPLVLQDAQAVAFSIVGCYLAIRGMSDIAWFGPARWSGVTQLVLGIALFVNSQGISKIWWSLRQVGHTEALEESNLESDASAARERSS